MQQLRHSKSSLLAPLGLLVVLGGIGRSSPVAATTVVYQEQRILWDESAGVVLPASAHFGGSLCTAVGGGGVYAIVGAPEGAGWADPLFDGSRWLVDPYSQQVTSPVGPQPYTCGPDGSTSNILRAQLMSDGTYRIWSLPNGEVLVSGIDGAPVETVAKIHTTLAVGQPDWGTGGRVLFYRLNQQFGWLIDREFTGAIGERLGASLVMLSVDAALAGAPGAGANGEVRFLFSDTSGGYQFTWFESPAGCCQNGSAEFGATLAKEGGWLAIGSPKYDRLIIGGGGTVSDVGAVYLYQEDLLSWQLRTVVRPPEARANDRFGSSLALRTISSDGTILVAGSPLEDNDATFNEGAAYVYGLEGDQWRVRWRLLDRQPSGLDELGTTVAISSEGVLVGAPKYWGNGTPGQGAVLFFRLPLFADGFESGNTNAWSEALP